jgi:glycosyltransferase involved in cell wall biosynthesis
MQGLHEDYRQPCRKSFAVCWIEPSGMRIVQITPGAGGMYCGNCFRDNTLVAALRREGHDVLMVPLYLPMTLDEEDQASGMPIFFSGVSVYLEQKIPLLGKMPGWMHKRLASPGLLQWAARRAAKTRASELGDLTLSMIRGEEGRQAREVDELASYLKQHHQPDIISLSNALLAGMARKLKRELNASIVCMLQGEDSFLDALPESHRQRTWNALAERCNDIDLFIAPSKYFANLMTQRLNLPPARVRVVYNGLELDGWRPAATMPNPPVLGYFARMCKEKGLHTLVDAFISLKKGNRVSQLKLHIGGAMGPADETFVNDLKLRLQGNGVLGDVTFFSNVTKEQKQQFFRRITAMSVPALYGEAFGLYLLESWAAGVPVVQPPVASFPELIEATGGGIVSEGTDSESLAKAIEGLLLTEEKRASASRSALAAMQERFTARAMTQNMLEAFRTIAS